jgi:peptidoglycan/xylan/chitin deacetylase (PgdA/CDA1 family)
MEAVTLVVDPAEVDSLLRKAFPQQTWSLDELATRRGVKLSKVVNLNSPGAAAELRGFDADLGVVLGTRILKRSTFGIPRLGSINLHKGKVPEYRGMPPGFWEIYDRSATAGITVHFVDDGLDTGDIIAETDIPIHANETPYSLRNKLDARSVEVLAGAVSAIASGQAVRRRQPAWMGKARTRPTRREVAALAARSPHLAVLNSNIGRRLIKTASYVAIYWSGLLSLRRALARRRGAGILLYHRLADAAFDSLTVSRRRFAEHLVLLKKYYGVQPSGWIVRQLQTGGALGRNVVAIQFDDCYESVFTIAAPLLAAAGLPATSFVSSGYIDSERVFPHDQAKAAVTFRNLSSGQVCRLPDFGVAIGSHTVNHVDMGEVSSEEAWKELADSRMALERITGSPVTLFSFPYGRQANFRPEYRRLAFESGYDAIFSAYGGFVTPQTALYDIPRFAVAESHRPIDLLMDLEGFGRIRR